jgi:predicted nucleic acid-binding protein
MEDKCILLDTSFNIRLLNDQDPLHKNVLGFYQHFLEKEFRLKFSTISVAEYCVKGKLDELPLRNLELLPFNLNHAVKAGDFANMVFANRKTLDLGNRLIIPNDSKLFAQAHVEKEIGYFATSDVECIKIYNLLKDNFSLSFEIINIREPLSAFLGILPFPT